MEKAELSASEYGWVTAIDNGRTLAAKPYRTKERAVAAALRSTDLVPMPLVGVCKQRLASTRMFRDSLKPEDIQPPFEQSSIEYSDNPFIDFEDDWVFLDGTWKWKAIEKDAVTREGHHHIGVRHHNVGEMYAKLLYDLEDSLVYVHGAIPPKSVADFFSSWQVWCHLCTRESQFESSATSRSLIRSKPTQLKRELSDARHAVYYRLWSYIHEQRRAAKLQRRHELDKMSASDLWALLLAHRYVPPADVWKPFGPSARMEFHRFRGDKLGIRSELAKKFRHRIYELLEG